MLTHILRLREVAPFASPHATFVAACARTRIATNVQARRRCPRAGPCRPFETSCRPGRRMQPATGISRTRSPLPQVSNRRPCRVGPRPPPQLEAPWTETHVRPWICAHSTAWQMRALLARTRAPTLSKATRGLGAAMAAQGTTRRQLRTVLAIARCPRDQHDLGPRALSRESRRRGGGRHALASPTHGHTGLRRGADTGSAPSFAKYEGGCQTAVAQGGPAQT